MESPTNTNESRIFIRKNIPEWSGLSDVQKRVYGILREENTDFRDTKSIFEALPYLSHNGVNWQWFSDKRLEDWLYNQLQWGRSVEVIICESLISLDLPWFHFLPTKEFDLSYKTDLISRIPYFLPTDTWKKLRTLSIGSQITVMEIPENMEHYNSHERCKKKKKYMDKMNQIIQMNEYLHLPETRKDLKKYYGKLTLPDIMCFIAVNGNIRKTFWADSTYLHQEFEKWRVSDFQTDSLIENLEPHLRDDIYDIARFISDTQKYIFSKEFLQNKDMKNGRSFEQILDTGKDILYDSNSGTLECFFRRGNEVLSKITYLFIHDDMKKLKKKYTQNQILQNQKNPPHV